MITTANRKLFLLRRLKRFGVSTQDLTTVYTTYIRPAMEYAAPVWHPALTRTQSTRLERLQKRACRIILGTQYKDYNAALSSLNLIPLEERRTNICLSFATKLLNSEFKDWLPPTRKQITGRHTRNSNKLDTPMCRTMRYKNSAIPYMTDLLNNL